MRERLQEYALRLHPDKTRLIEFGRFAAARRAQRGLGKPETFDFLGFTFICGQSRRGKFLLKRKSRRDRMRAKLRDIKDQLWRMLHQPIPEQGRWLQQVVPATSPITQCRPMLVRLRPSDITSPNSGGARFGGAARKTTRRGSGSRS
jgi:hypothetical protein